MDKLLKKLEKIYGIGPVRAKSLAPLLDPNKPVRSQLKQPAIYEGLAANTKADLQYNPTRKIPRYIMDDINQNLKPLKNYVMAGSYRRGREFSRDIDIVLIHTGFSDMVDVQRLIDKINNDKIQIVEVFANGPDKAGAIMRYVGEKTIYVKVDFFASSKENYVFMLLFTTGSGEFNTRMRAVAKHKGYLLNQHGLFKDGKKLMVKTERELFKLLNMKYRKPTDR